MNINKVFIFNAIFAVLGGLGLLFMSDKLMEPYGVVISSGTVFMAQLMGGFLLGVALLSWMARNLKDKESIRVISLGFLVSHAATALIGIFYLVSGGIGFAIWIDIILHSVFALGFYYFGLRKKAV